MSDPTTASAVCYTVTIVLMVNGTRHQHLAARNLLHTDALALAAAYGEYGYTAWLTPQTTTPFTVWTPQPR